MDCYLCKQRFKSGDARYDWGSYHVHGDCIERHRNGEFTSRSVAEIPSSRRTVVDVAYGRIPNIVGAAAVASAPAMACGYLVAVGGIGATGLLLPALLVGALFLGWAVADT